MTKVIGMNTMEYIKLDIETLNSYLEEEISCEDGDFIYAAFYSEELIGFYLLGIHPNVATLTLCYLSDNTDFYKEIIANAVERCEAVGVNAIVARCDEEEYKNFNEIGFAFQGKYVESILEF
ncbi:hypothetical protein [Flammeovirga agarivorans]|uniref:N-acetyltransferase domain-containing protein n=1 Tax=Flammeovirga agarivorans TaxID=2726742 RepID=A0A7X8XZE6_9BACT|nr:hypothetical protein [Flammeovirga agarivorans]NLR94910.1 hypothetical protein [Flammeovirga agarivorans]